MSSQIIEFLVPKMLHPGTALLAGEVKVFRKLTWGHFCLTALATALALRVIGQSISQMLVKGVE